MGLEALRPECNQEILWLVVLETVNGIFKFMRIIALLPNDNNKIEEH